MLWKTGNVSSGGIIDWIYSGNLCDKYNCHDFISIQQTIHMKYHTLFVIFEKAAKFAIVVCCKLLVALYGLMSQITMGNIDYNNYLL